MASHLVPPPEVLAVWEKIANPDYPSETQGQNVLAMEIVFLIICPLVVALRVYVRIYVTKTFGLDDSLIIFNLLPLSGLGIVLCLAITTFNWNRHVYDIYPSMFPALGRTSVCIQAFYLFSTTTTKVSILLFYRRLTDHVMTRFRHIIYTGMFVVTSGCLGGFLGLLLICRPLSAYWLRLDLAWRRENEGKYQCGDEARLSVAVASYAMVTDFIVCILPLSIFIKLKMHWRQKLALSAIFCAGFFLCFCGIMRMLKLIHTFYGNTHDITWTLMPAWMWTGIEAHMAVIIASLPALNHFFRCVLNQSNLSDKFKSTSLRFGGRFHTSSGYNKASNSTLPDRTDDSQDRVIYVTQNIQLETFARDRDMRSRHGMQRAKMRRFVEPTENAAS